MTVRPVVVVGDVGLDVLVRPKAGVVRGGDTPSDVRILPGGAGGNTAAWLASAGAPVALVSRVGDDDAGPEGVEVEGTDVHDVLQRRVGGVEQLEADVAPEAVDDVGAHPAADPFVGLEDGDVHARGAQPQRAGQPGQAGADDHHPL